MLTATRDVKLSKMQSPRFPSSHYRNYREQSLAPQAEKGYKASSFVSPTNL